MTLHSKKCFFVFLFCDVCFSGVFSQSAGWFGPNKVFKCHCESGCSSDGTCQGNGKCARGWFGLKCQHQDLTLLENTIISPNIDLLTDRDDTTCLNVSIQTINITFNITYVFTWIRLTVKDPASLPGFKVEFSTSASLTPKIKCLNQKYFLVDNATLDIQCNLTEAIQTVIITGTGQTSLCSLYINGGRNVALKQKTSQTSDYSELDKGTFDASRAVDGSTNSDFSVGLSCTHTSTTDSSPMWNVSFPLSKISRYVIYNRDDTFIYRLKNFVLLGENSGSTMFIYNDTSSTGLPVYIITDPAKNKLTNVKISLSVPILTLCEVEIYGECPAGSWELNCRTCKQSCPNNCHWDDGSCNEVCFGAMDPPGCKKECDNGGFGLNCTKKCPENCLNHKCDGFSGTCLSCDAGFTGETCNTSCSQGKWGFNCNMTCISNCKNQSCDRINGQCSNGCIDGYVTPTCIQACNSGYWGAGCVNPCNTNCYTAECNNSNGVCTSGCIAGYQSTACNTSCPDGTWGIGCAGHCSSNCKNQHCHKTDGQCVDGCTAGYTSPNCTIVCNATNYGQNCTEKCSSNCTDSKCHHIYGTCLQCTPGFQGDLCDNVCNETSFGQNCSFPCSPNCTDQKCHHVTGECLACYSGYHGDSCNTTCEPTKFGENCAANCSMNCMNQTCHHVNGTCHECYPGYRGNQCDQFCENKTYGQDCMTNCSINCTDQNCHPGNGSCISCYPGYVGDVCDKVCDAGLYGQNCLYNCSLFCNTSSECEPQNGTCYDGCKDGYTGDNCNYKCQDRTYGPKCAKLCSAQCKTKSSVTCHHVSGQCLTECEEDYSGQYCENKDSSVASSKVGAIVGSIVAIIILAVLAAVGAIIWKRKLQRKPEDKNEEVMHLDNIREKAEQETAGDSTYINVAGILINTKIAVEVLNKYIDSHTGDFFTEQYKKVPKPRNVTTEVAVSENNNNKNRYKNICPYDHSRVHLKINTNKQEGDYINASYVRDSHNDVKFIAAQGPFSIVVNDFVRMLWEQKIEKVVMLTNLIEEGKPKCDKYWPDSGNAAFGEITVKLKDTQILADYVIRKIELEKSDAPTQSLTHYHFTSWPDQGVPVTPWALVDFEQRVDINSSTAPVVVHCSAGVGRTGTFIALHNILSQAKETGSVDFYKTLVKLREDRFLMIQTPDQYIFLHKAAQAAIVSMGTTVIFNDSKTRMQHLLTKSISGMSNMEKEFQNICAICQNESNPKTNSEAIYQNTENVKVVDTKNRFESIIPKNCYRPYLGSDSKEFDDYINAVFVQGFYKKDQQILTQLPMPSTLIDFFRLVTQHRVSLIVAFEVDKRSTDQTIANYLPSQDKPITASPFSIRSMGIKGDNMWEEHTIKVINENTKAEHDVIHWKCKVLDPDARRLLSLVNKSRSYNAHANGRIIYTCRDGATYSGLACVLSLLLDRIDHDTCLAIPLVVGSVKSIRPQVISTFEHYVMLHEALQSYNDTTAAYTNMEENFFPRFSSLKNKDLDESQAKEGNVYSNM